MTVTIIFLNGVGSVGKSAVAKALQLITREPFLHIEMDAFLDMMPQAFQDHPEGLSFATTIEDDKPSVHAKTGDVAERVLAGMRHGIAAMAQAGNNLIVDEVLFCNVATRFGNPVSEYRTLLAPYRTHWVGVFAPLDCLEERERLRGDRQIGLARWQYDRVHQAMTYDLEISTERASPMACARIIQERFDL